MHTGSISVLRRRLTAVAVLVAVLGALAATAVGTTVANALLRPELDATGVTVANGLARDLVHAHRLGIPLDEYLGMDAYLRSVVDDAPSVRAVTVLDHDGRILYRHGDAADWSLYDVEVPLDTEGHALGQVRVSLDRFIYLNDAGAEVILIAAVTLGIALAAAWITAGLASARVFEPLASAGRSLVRGARGDFRTAPRRSGLGQPRAVAEAVAAVVEHLRHDWQALRERAMAARAAHFDPAVLSRVDQVTGDLADRYRLPVEDTARDAHLATRGGLQLVTFLLVAAEAACVTSVASSPLLIAATWGVAVAVAALPGSVVPVSGRSAIISGALVAALGYVVAAGLDAGAGQAGARLVVGLGLGTAFRSIGTLAVQWRGLLATRSTRHAILSACVGGPLLGGVLATELSSAAPYALAATFAATAILVGRWLPPEPRTGGRGALTLPVTLAVLLGGGALVLGALPASLVALWPGWSVEAVSGLVMSLAVACVLAVLRLVAPLRTPRC